MSTFSRVVLVWFFEPLAQAENVAMVWNRVFGKYTPFGCSSVKVDRNPVCDSWNKSWLFYFVFLWHNETQKENFQTKALD